MLFQKSGPTQMKHSGPNQFFQYEYIAMSLLAHDFPMNKWIVSPYFHPPP